MEEEEEEEERTDAVGLVIVRKICSDANKRFYLIKEMKRQNFML